MPFTIIVRGYSTQSSGACGDAVRCAIKNLAVLHKPCEELKRLSVSYFHTRRPRTIIDAKRFHFWVRDEFRWFPLAMVASKLVGIIPSMNTGVVSQSLILEI